MKYLSCAETAKLVRQALKEAFPRVNFSVRSKRYSGGASISVRWTDGPNDAQVSAITSGFAGAYFDGSIDYQGSVYHMLQGKQVSFGADFIFTTRDDSEAAVERAIGHVYRKFEGNFGNSCVPRPTVKAYVMGELWSVRLPGLHDWNGQNLQTEIGAVIAKHTFTPKVGKSATALSVFVTHDDGYSKTSGSGMSAVNVDSGDDE
ncbi:hypothetical protein OVY01_11875 [Robbsia sp. Bb-Pol-6]|uniref:Large polyvalent protein associated domain-containing protein n=1 Tax=Robbsia betulipollinis TaxID=2981849 RepID=A0ABT3ZMZ0_9BURK|nr:LPD29 domain-containing protein [Robbsia betulipollinis]MCY0387921.1 hypothetical protein [Robbsia betulipollinis]